MQYQTKNNQSSEWSPEKWANLYRWTENRRKITTCSRKRKLFLKEKGTKEKKRKHTHQWRWHSGSPRTWRRRPGHRRPPPRPPPAPPPRGSRAARSSPPARSRAWFGTPGSTAAPRSRGRSPPRGVSAPPSRPLPASPSSLPRRRRTPEMGGRGWPSEGYLKAVSRRAPTHCVRVWEGKRSHMASNFTIWLGNIFLCIFLSLNKKFGLFIDLYILFLFLKIS